MAFMVPMASYFTADEAFEYARHDDDADREDFKAGFYGYLSAPGYLDRADYSGPFATADEALAYVMDLYGVDENGDDLTEEEGEPTE